MSHGALVFPEAGVQSAARLEPRHIGSGQSGPVTPELRREYLSALARHQDIKRELVPLLAAWRAAGIDALLYKGFFLSEFVYPVPGVRFHGDVDLLLPPVHGQAALSIASRLGWNQTWVPERFGEEDGAVLFRLHRPGGTTQLDVHHLLVPARPRWTRRQRRITDAVWANSTVQEWEGTAVRLPTPVDAVVVNLALERAVADGARGLKAHDSVDLFHLMARGRVTHAELHRRATELGCVGTLAGFLRLCQPSGEPVVPRSLPSVARTRWGAVGLWESGFLHIPLMLLRILRAPGLAWGVVRTLPLLARVRHVLRRQGDVHGVLESLTAAGSVARSSPRTRWSTVRAIHWAVRLLPLGSAGGPCLQKALAIYAALRRQGWDVTFVSGVGRGAEGLQGHAWVEENGLPLRELAGRERVTPYRANFRYP